MYPRRIVFILVLAAAGLLFIPAVGLPYGVPDRLVYSQAYGTDTPAQAFRLSSPATGTATVTITPTRTPTTTPTVTPSASPTATTSETETPTATTSPTATATETSTSTPSVTPTSTVTGEPSPTATATSTATPTPSGGRVVGKVAVQGRTNFQGVRIEVDGVLAATTGQNGNFETSEVAPGTHVVRASMQGYLPAEKAGVIVVTEQTTTLASVQLRGGDIDGDSEVGLLDLVIVASNYRMTPPADARADINADGLVDLFDLVLVAGNYRRTGPIVWP